MRGEPDETLSSSWAHVEDRKRLVEKYSDLYDQFPREVRRTAVRQTCYREGRKMFRRRFFLSTLLSVPVRLYSPTLQDWLGFSVPTFPGSTWVNPVFAVIVFASGGVPFLRTAVQELRDCAPGMMTLISKAIIVAFVYSLVGVAVRTTTAFFWEVVTLIDITFLGHWIEMRSVRRASSALDELARLVPATAERTEPTA